MERGRKVTLLRHFPSGGTQQGPPTTSWPEPSYIATPGRNEGWEISLLAGHIASLDEIWGDGSWVDNQ